MNYYTFEYPFLILLLIPILYCLYKCKEQLLPKFFVHLQFLHAKKSYMKLEWIVKILIFILLTIAITSPVIVDKMSHSNRHGKDIVLCMDASGSMNASGFDSEDEFSGGQRLSRFELTKKIATNFIKKRENDNIGVVLYGDFAFIASPITYEKEIVSDMISYLNQGMAGQNTAIGEAIAMSIRAFKHSRAKTKIIILLTDGEHNSGSISPKVATDLANKLDIKIYTIAIAEDLDNSLFQEIAQESSGKFFFAKDAKELEKVYEQINALESSKIKSKEYLQKDFYYHFVLLFAGLLLLFLIFRELRR